METPVKVYNRPGLKAVSYRTGDHSKFRESLLARLSASQFPALQKLTTRNDDDFTIALLDAWSSVADVITFYQERIANESYLGTATEQFSVLQLARLIGYELKPGVAASTYLAFTLEDVPGQLLLSPAGKSQAEIPPVLIEPGTKVQSTPGPAETAQTFETIAPITARPEWNAILPRLSQPQLAITDENILVLTGSANDLKAGDIVLIDEKYPRKILKVGIDSETETTLLWLKSDSSIPSFSEPALTPEGNISDYPEKIELTESLVDELIQKIWKTENLSTLIKTQGWSEKDFSESFTTALSKQVSKIPVSVFRKKASVFGYNALKQVTYSGSIPKAPSLWDEWTLNETNNIIYLDTPNDQILPGSCIAVQKQGVNTNGSTAYKVIQADTRSRTAYGISSKTTELTIDSNSGWWDTTDSNLSAIRSISVHTQNDPLILSQVPIREAISGSTLTLNRFYPGLTPGCAVILTGERADLPGMVCNEIKILKEVLVSGGLSVLIFDTPLSHSYIRSKTTINANVAPATHGETVKEILGSGNAAAIFQKFVLKQNPLTYISSSTPSGTASTLEIRVNNLLWTEVPSFFGRGPGEHIYTTRQDDEGKTTVIFGDGKNGSRLPTGQENIRAVYRKGTGTAGIVKANQLSQLITRPLGVKAATNPFGSSGAQNRELLEDARRNAKLTIYTLDRIVSLKDYEDFARAFAGISKALATWTWSGQKRSVYLTVAGSNGAIVETDSILYKNLLSAIGRTGIPGVGVILASYQSRTFKVSANVQVHPDYVPESVLSDIEASVRNCFSFDKREFGQIVALSEVISVMQDVKGVIAVDIDELYRSDQSPELKDRVFAEVPRPGNELIVPAELITLDAGPLTLKIML